MRKSIFFILVLFSFISTYSQTKSTTDIQQMWFGFFNQTRVANKFGFWFDGHLRTKEDFANNFSTLIIRPGLTYYVNDNSKLTAGYAYVEHYPAEGHTKISQTEHRLWQQYQWHTKYAKTRMMQWLRLEERYRRKIANDSTLAEGYNFTYRLRYNLFWEIPFTQKPTHKFSLVVNDEIHINFGEQVVYNYFDQNRFFLGLKLNVNRHDNVQLGYMNMFQQLASGNKFRNNHVVRLFYFQNLDLRRK